MPAVGWCARSRWRSLPRGTILDVGSGLGTQDRLIAEVARPAEADQPPGRYRRHGVRMYADGRSALARNSKRARPEPSWPLLVTASYLPLLAAVLATLAGASALTAANAGLVVAIVLLTVHGWLAGRAARLQSWKLLVATAIAAGLGLVMILLKDLVLTHLH